MLHLPPCLLASSSHAGMIPSYRDKGSYGGRVECGMETPYLEKVVVGLLGQGGGR